MNFLASCTCVCLNAKRERGETNGGMTAMRHGTGRVHVNKLVEGYRRQRSASRQVSPVAFVAHTHNDGVCVCVQVCVCVHFMQLALFALSVDDRSGALFVCNAFPPRHCQIHYLFNVCHYSRVTLLSSG